MTNTIATTTIVGAAIEAAPVRAKARIQTNNRAIGAATAVETRTIRTARGQTKAPTTTRADQMNNSTMAVDKRSQTTSISQARPHTSGTVTAMQADLKALKTSKPDRGKDLKPVRRQAMATRTGRTMNKDTLAATIGITRTIAL